MRRTYWYHEECLTSLGNAVRTSKSAHHEICARCGYEGVCVEVELVTNPVPSIGEERKEREVGESIVQEVQEPRQEESPNETAVAEVVAETVEEAVAASLETEDAPVEAENETMSEIEQLRAQIAELEQKQSED